LNWLVLLVHALGFALVVGVCGTNTRNAPANAESTFGDEHSRALFSRWRSRAIAARAIAASAAILNWIAWSVLKGTFSLDVLLVVGFGCVAISLSLSEIRILTRRKIARTARLEVRRLNQFLGLWQSISMTVFAIISVELVAFSFMSRSFVPARLPAAISLTALAIGRLLQHGVVARGRPAAGSDLTSADNLIRRLSINYGIAEPTSFFAASLLAMSFGRLVSVFGVLAGVLQILFDLLAIFLWRKNANSRPEKLRLVVK
jgi:hypothetical protein